MILDKCPECNAKLDRKTVVLWDGEERWWRACPNHRFFDIDEKVEGGIPSDSEVFTDQPKE